MAKGSDCPPKLSFNQANAICKEFLPIGDEVFRYMAHLREAGFEAFLPRHRFIESFAETPEELQSYRLWVVERAKEWLGQPIPILISDDELKRVYFSPILQRWREERDEANGVPAHQLSSRYPVGEAFWRLEVDPCQRRKAYATVTDREAHEAQFATVLEEERRALVQESSRHATGLGKIPHTFDQAGRYAFFTAVMKRDAPSLGFHYDKSRSRSKYPVFSKAISSDWDLCWALEDPRFFFHSPFEGHFSPFLEIRGRGLRRGLNKAQSGDLLYIRYAHIVPGFFGGYRTFFDLDELETIIKSHLFLYSLMAPIIEGGIQKVLGDLSSVVAQE